MPTANTVVIGAINHHEWPVVAPWIRSLRGTGFDGRVVLVAYEDIADHVIDAMRRENVEVRRAKMEISVNRGRFKDFETILAEMPAETLVIATDVRDVVFQSNPSKLAELLKPAEGLDIAVSSEGWRYCDSEWNLSTLRKVFPSYETSMHGEEVYCSGVIVGTAASLKQMCARIWEISRTAPSFNGDQVAMNIILREPAFAHRVNRLDVRDGRVFHARATWLRRMQGNSVTGEPVFSLLTGMARRADGSLVSVLHQYTESKWERLRVLMRYDSLWIGIWYRLTQRFRSSANDNVYWKTKPAT